MKLYEISSALLSVLSASDETGELTPEQADSLTALEGKFADKVQGVCCVIRQAQTDAEAAKAEASRLTAMASSRQRLADGLKAYLKLQMESTGQEKVKTDLFAVRIQKNSVPSCKVVVPAAELPPGFQRVTVEPDNAALVAAFKGGAALPDGVTVAYGSHLRIQ